MRSVRPLTKAVGRCQHQLHRTFCATKVGDVSHALTNLIIDTDAGCDDAVAIMVALQAETRGESKVHALTTCFGNVSCSQATYNVGALLSGLNREDIPFYRGAEHPIIGQWGGCGWPGHGSDGLGDCGVTCPAHMRPEANAPHAAVKLVELVRERPQHYDILALGPLTNIAIAAALGMETHAFTLLRACLRSLTRPLTLTRTSVLLTGKILHGDGRH
jgi:hypothetical protein